MKIKNGIGIVLAALAGNLALDRITKLLAIQFLKDRPPVSFLHDTFILWYTENDGAFLSLGSNWPAVLKIVVLLIVPMIVCFFCFVYCSFFEKNRTRSLLITTIAAGGISNLYDRLVNDFRVIDFMNFGIGNLRTGILNVADLSVTFGVILLLVFEMRTGKTIKG